jgi:exodeoxyribonuclease VII large subunit
LNNLKSRTNAAIKAIVHNCRIQLTAQANRLAGLNPKSVLQRGYSITTNKKTGLLIKSPEDVQIADDIITELAEEKLIESKVTKK